MDGAAKSTNVSANAATNASSDMIWNFQALLDGKPIGTHRFSISAQGDERTLVSVADLTVKFLGLTVYRYRHKATEQWRGDCLRALSATTDDDGQLSSVRSAQDGNVFSVMTPAAVSVPGCVMSYAYWNPAMRAQTRLLNAQTGRLDTVSIVRVDSAAKAGAHGLPSGAMKFRINGQTNPIDVWYSAQGEWIGLDANVRGGHTLSYRLQ
jgi:hypothetical protein